MSKLFSEYKLGNISLKNRVMMAPMCMYSADHEGNPSRWHYTHYTTRAVGGVGLVVLEATAVEPRGRISENDLGIWDDHHIDGLKEIVDGIHEFGSKAGIQLAHAGRKSEVTNEAIIGPSPIAFSDEYKEPLEMTKEDIDGVVKAFAKGAKRADKAGFDVIEIHAAHGYLINEFLSPLSNKRLDEYGGSMENRVRLLKEVLEAIAQVWPKDKAIIVRVSAEDYVEEGNHPNDLGQMLAMVKDLGIDAVNVSSGAVVSVRPKAYPGYQVKMAEIVGQISGIDVIAGGLITNAQMAEEIVQNDRAAMIYLGRELLRNPYWALQAASEIRDDITWPIQYERGKLK